VLRSTVTNDGIYVASAPSALGTASVIDSTLDANRAVRRPDRALDGSCPGITDGVNGYQAGSPASPLNPGLGPLASNGGPRQTLALLALSPAIGAKHWSSERRLRGVGTDSRCGDYRSSLAEGSEPRLYISVPPGDDVYDAFRDRARRRSGSLLEAHSSPRRIAGSAR
jgi:hypothetical protein